MIPRRIAIVGAGIVGLAHAWAAVKRGYGVTVFERDERAVGASVRNFGLGLLLGQPQGDLLTLALRSRAMWLELLAGTGCWHKTDGSLTVARNDYEMAVLEAFQAELGPAYETRLVSAAEAEEHHAAGMGGLFSPHEIAIESRVAVPAFAKWLAEVHGVKFNFGVQVNEVSLPQIRTSAGIHHADQIIVCSGHDFRTLYPEVFSPLSIRRCALQMLRISNPGVELQPALLTGLSTLHYPSFTRCAALADPLNSLRDYVASNHPEWVEHGIHLIIQQVGKSGDLIIGDSHHYGQTTSPFNHANIDSILIDLAESLLKRQLKVIERWQGIYASGPKPYEVIQVADNVLAVAITSGIGMSIALALAERNLSQ